MIDTLTSNLTDLCVEIDYEYDPGEPEIRYYPGRRGGLPNGDGHPGCDPSVTLLQVFIEKDGRKLDILDYLPDAEIKALEKVCLEDVEKRSEMVP